MSNIDPIQDLEYDPRNNQQYQYEADLTWSLQSHNHSPILSQNDMKRSTSPIPMSFQPNTYHHHHQNPITTYPPTTSSTATVMMPSQHQQQYHHHHHHDQHQQHHHQHQHPHQEQQQWHIPAQNNAFSPMNPTFDQQTFGAFDNSFQTLQHPAMDQVSFEASLQANVEASIANTMVAGMAINDTYTTMAFNDALTAELHPAMEHINMPLSWSTALPNLYAYDMPPSMTQQTVQHMGSPVALSETYMSETHSLHSWEHIEASEFQNGAIFNPQETLHPRTSSASSSDIEVTSRGSLDGFVDVGLSASSPSNDSSGGEMAYSDQDCHHEMSRRTSEIATRPVIIPRLETESHSDHSSPPARTPVSPTSRGGRPRKSTATSKAGPVVKAVKKTTSVSGKEGEKRVGRRKGPLREDQRKQASEIRKLGACIRCRFLKKTCDPGNPCTGCRPSHARLWLVPCTRIDIKDLGYFVKDWKADYQRHVSLGFSVGNIKGFSEKEVTLFVTHGYDQFLPIQAREIYVRDNSVFGVDWVEADENGVMSSYGVNTARLTTGEQGISNSMINDYLDRHLDSNFEKFVDEFFQGAPFFPEILKVVHRYWLREKTPAIRTALKFVLAYNLTQAVCLIKPVNEEQETYEGTISDDSTFRGFVAAPVMINFAIKCAMAEQWRALQAEVLAELGNLYTRVYSKDKLKHWPTIFMLGSILLVVWEEMQFDCRYRIPEESIVDRFCKEMTDTPVGVVIGLFSAISQKIPSFLEWDTHKHQDSLGSNPSVCTTMEEVRDEIKKNEEYLRSRGDASFDRNDFDSLSNMFVSKLVIRAH